MPLSINNAPIQAPMRLAPLLGDDALHQRIERDADLGTQLVPPAGVAEHSGWTGQQQDEYRAALRALTPEPLMRDAAASADPPGPAAYLRHSILRLYDVDGEATPLETLALLAETRAILTRLDALEPALAWSDGAAAGDGCR